MNNNNYNNGSYTTTDYTGLDVNGYGSSSCPKCGSTDICKGSTNHCNKCGNRWS